MITFFDLSGFCFEHSFAKQIATEETFIFRPNHFIWPKRGGEGPDRLVRKCENHIILCAPLITAI